MRTKWQCDRFSPSTPVCPVLITIPMRSSIFCIILATNAISTQYTHNTRTRSLITAFVKVQFWSLPVHRSTALISVSYFFKILLNVPSHLFQGLPSGLFHLDFFANPRKICIPLLSYGWIILTIFVRKFKLRSPSLNISHSPLSPPPLLAPLFPSAVTPHPSLSVCSIIWETNFNIIQAYCNRHRNDGNLWILKCKLRQGLLLLH